MATTAKVSIKDLKKNGSTPETSEEKKAKIQTTVEFSKDTMKVIIPEHMSKKDAAHDLLNQWENEEQNQRFIQKFDGYDYKDALYAVRNVIEDKFGWLKMKETWFSTPTEQTIITDYQNGKAITEVIFMGKLSFPAYQDALAHIGLNDEGVAYFLIDGKKKFSTQINTLFKEILQYLKNNSIYRGKAVILDVNPLNQLVLEITELKENNKIILNNRERVQIEELVIGELETPGKDIMLFTGAYGNGKSETAMKIAIEATKLNISFFYVKKTALFARALAFAKNYEPAILFVEDIDQVASGDTRDADMNQILNTVDGVETKGRNIKVIFTTNHEKRINPALRRPGRIDMIVQFDNPNVQTKGKIFEAYLEDFEGHEDVDYEMLLPLVGDVAAAVIAKMADRAAKLAKRHGNQITTQRVQACIQSMEHQIKFMAEPTEAFDEVAKAFDVVRDYQQGEKSFNH